MKKNKKKGIIKLIILVILLIAQVKIFRDSRANNVTYITANIIDAKGLVSAETSSIIAINEGENGMAIMLPDILNTKKVTKEIIRKEEDTTNEENEVYTNSIDSSGINEESNIIDTNTQTSEETITKTVEMLPGEKVYLTQEEISDLAITLKVEYDTKEVNSQLLFNRKVSFIDEDDYEVLSISGYMPKDAKIDVKEIDITEITSEIIEKYPESFLIGNYDIKLIANEKEYIAKDFGEKLTVEISIIDGSKYHYVLKVKGNEIQEYNEFKIENGKLKFSTENFENYLILEMQNGPVVYAEENIVEESSGDSNGTAISIDGSNPIFEIDDFEAQRG